MHHAPGQLQTCQRFAAPMDVHYTLTQANDADISWLDQLRRDAYRELFTATWGGWDEARHLRHFAESIAQGNISIIEVDTHRVGMVQLVHHADALEVSEIQITPRDQNTGIGTAVLRDVIAAASENAKCVRLATGLKNLKALRLYLRLGFREMTQSETHYHLEFDARQK